MSVVYLVNKQSLVVLYAGPVPEVYGPLTGLAGVDYAVLQDLGATWSDYPELANLGFLTEADALRLGLPQVYLTAKKEAAWALEWQALNDERHALINAQRWRVDRYNDETMMNLQHVEDIRAVLTYIQAIRDLPNVYPDPYAIVWPTIPALPSA